MMSILCMTRQMDMETKPTQLLHYLKTPKKSLQSFSLD